MTPTERITWLNRMKVAQEQWLADCPYDQRLQLELHLIEMLLEHEERLQAVEQVQFESNGDGR